jgi:adenylate cyclase
MVIYTCDHMGNCYFEYDRNGAKGTVQVNTEEPIRIDRSSQSAVPLSDDPTVSLRHAIVQHLEPGKFYVTDLKSRNGTMLNGRPITVPSLLKAGDVIMIGTCKFVFCQEDAGVLDLERPADSWNTRLLISRKLTTVLVTDIKNYTGITLKMGESYISEIIGTIFQKGGRVLSANQCWAQKYVGDALMGLWIHEKQSLTREDISLIFRSLIDIKQVFDDLNKQYNLPIPISFGAGINSGYAEIGNMGSRDFPDFTALGDSVNKAFRLESATRELRADILLGDLTYTFLSALTDTSGAITRHVVSLKGYPEPQEAYAMDFRGLQSFVERLQ